MKIPICCLILVAYFSLKSNAQDVSLNNFSFYLDGVNPGSLLQNNDFNVFMAHKNEFTGFEQQPFTHLVDINYRLNDYKLGLKLMSDNIGFDKSLEVKFRISRQFFLDQNSGFSFGLAAGLINNRLITTKMSFEYPDDPISYTDYGKSWFDVDFGLEYFYKQLTLGLSSIHLGRYTDWPSINNALAHYYGYANYIFKINHVFSIHPNLICRVWQKNLLLKTGASGYFKNKIWLGASVSSELDVTVITGFKMPRNILFGYAFNTTANTKIFKPFGTNSHEIFLNFSVIKNRYSIKTPRFID